MLITQIHYTALAFPTRLNIPIELPSLPLSLVQVTSSSSSTRPHPLAKTLSSSPALVLAFQLPKWAGSQPSRFLVDRIRMEPSYWPPREMSCGYGIYRWTGSRMGESMSGGMDMRMTRGTMC